MYEYFVYKKANSDITKAEIIKDNFQVLCFLFPVFFLLYHRLYGHASVTFFSKVLIGTSIFAGYISYDHALYLGLIINLFITVSFYDWKREKMVLMGHELVTCGMARDDLSYMGNLVLNSSIYNRDESVLDGQKQEEVGI